jgi:hypothetical protein
MTTIIYKLIYYYYCSCYILKCYIMLYNNHRSDLINIPYYEEDNLLSADNSQIYQNR